MPSLPKGLNSRRKAERSALPERVQRRDRFPTFKTGQDGLFLVQNAARIEANRFKDMSRSMSLVYSLSAVTQSSVLR